VRAEQLRRERALGGATETCEVGDGMHGRNRSAVGSVKFLEAAGFKYLENILFFKTSLLLNYPTKHA
jgi:hypothetical protein